MRPASSPPPVQATSEEQRIGRHLLPLAAAAIAFLTLMPSGGGASAALTPFWCLVCGDYGSVDVFLNTLLFVPLGLALGLMGSSWRRILAIALVSSVCIESLQLTWIPGRDASISDMLTNTAGGVLGALIAIHWRRLVQPDTALARRILTALVVGWTAARVGTAWLLRGSFPDTNWYGQVAPRDVYPADFRGTVLHGAIGEVPARVGLQPELRAAVTGQTVAVRASVTGAVHTERLASVISVLDEHRTEMLVLGQEGDAVRLRFRLRTADALLRTPSIRLDAALPDSTTGVTELSGFLSPGRLSVSSAAGSRLLEATITLAPGMTWALLLPFDTGLTPFAAAAGTAALAAAVLMLVGYFASLSQPGRTTVATVLVLALTALGLWTPSVVFPEALVSVSELTAATLGALLGVAIGRAVTAAEARRARHLRRPARTV